MIHHTFFILKSKHSNVLYLISTYLTEICVALQSHLVLNINSVVYINMHCFWLCFVLPFHLNFLIKVYNIRVFHMRNLEVLQIINISGVKYQIASQEIKIPCECALIELYHQSSANSVFFCMQGVCWFFKQTVLFVGATYPKPSFSFANSCFNEFAINLN